MTPLLSVTHIFKGYLIIEPLRYGWHLMGPFGFIPINSSIKSLGGWTVFIMATLNIPMRINITKLLSKISLISTIDVHFV